CPSPVQTHCHRKNPGAPPPPIELCKHLATCSGHSTWIALPGPTPLWLVTRSAFPRLLHMPLPIAPMPLSGRRRRSALALYSEDPEHKGLSDRTIARVNPSHYTLQASAHLLPSQRRRRAPDSQESRWPQYWPAALPSLLEAGGCRDPDRRTSRVLLAALLPFHFHFLLPVRFEVVIHDRVEMFPQRLQVQPVVQVQFPLIQFRWFAEFLLENQPHRLAPQVRIGFFP